MKRTRYAIAALAALVLAGCIDTNITITVRTDGSGSIERTITVSPQLVELMVGMGVGADADAVQKEILGSDDLGSEAAAMGTGVTFVSAEPITTEKGSGHRAIYRFTDVTQLRIDQSPAAGVDLPSSPTDQGGEAETPEIVTFAFTKGTPATLTIMPPQPASAAAQGQAGPPPATGEGEEAEEAMEMIRELYGAMRVRVAVVVQGTITKTDATHVDGSTITLMDLDFSQILSDESVFRKLAGTEARSLAQAQEALKGVPGVKIETRPSVTVSFR
jgi:hypothetical protein